MSVTRSLVLALLCGASAAALGVGVGACESATNLDVTYGDASAALEAAAGDADAEVKPTEEILPGCPCDESAGLGCCMPKIGKPFCTADEGVCAKVRGTYLRCVRPNPLTESVCCWRPEPKVGAVTGLAGSCDGGVPACQTDGDCAGTGMACNTQDCYGNTIKIGACGPTKPECPQQ